MPRPSELTPEQRLAEGEALEEERRQADRADAGLFCQQELIFNADEAQLRATLPEKEVNEILAYRQAHSGD